jgi:hypothetical protein
MDGERLDHRYHCSMKNETRGLEDTGRPITTTPPAGGSGRTRPDSTRSQDGDPPGAAVEPILAERRFAARPCPPSINELGDGRERKSDLSIA